MSKASQNSSDLRQDLTIGHGKEIVPGEHSIQSLKLIFHEFGHAKNALEHGEFHVENRYVEEYYDFLNAHWMILRDEFIAEMFVANIFKLLPSLNWYGNFSDSVEKDNFRSYVNDYRLSREDLDWNLAFQLLHQYYFYPLFQKAGFLEGVKSFMDIGDIAVCETVAEILSYGVIENTNVPELYNLLILKIWDDFQIVDMLRG